MNDKMQRFQQIVMNNQEPENESLMDTILGLKQTGSGIKTKKLRIKSSKNKTKKLY